MDVKIVAMKNARYLAFKTYEPEILDPKALKEWNIGKDKVKQQR